MSIDTLEIDIHFQLIRNMSFFLLTVQSDFQKQV